MADEYEEVRVGDSSHGDGGACWAYEREGRPRTLCRNVGLGIERVGWGRGVWRRGGEPRYARESSLVDVWVNVCLEKRTKSGVNEPKRMSAGLRFVDRGG